jgi:hypothetical protein
MTAINDPELVADVIRSAMNVGYVLIGPGRAVFLRVGGSGRGGYVERASSFEAAAVAQLLDSGHLKTGGTHIVCYGDREGPAQSVLVPNASRRMVARWGAYRPLHGSIPTQRTSSEKPDLRLI